MFDLLRRLLIRHKRFGEEHFRSRERFRPDYGRLATSLLARLDFDSVLDIGCANGFLLEAFQAAGKRVAGVELSPAAVAVLPASLRPHIAIGDFTAASGRWDLVSCVEVAEHIEPSRSTDLVDTVAGAAARHVYFTAAPPGQSGRGHVNCREHAEWLDWFAVRGWVLDGERTESLRADLEGLELAVWLRGNSMILRRG
ncbi:MAG: methyltransferase domain-containing protein [Acidobacteria bacterium]|nr:methyltransferase domain-containing protein [Acidobacteriota bacterium]